MSIQPTFDDCVWHFHPTTVKVFDAIDALYAERYDKTWADVAETAGVSLSTVMRHVAVLESADVNYLERDWCTGHFSSIELLMDMHAPIEYECEPTP